MEVNRDQPLQTANKVQQRKAGTKLCLQLPICPETMWPCLGSASFGKHSPMPVALLGIDHQTWQQLCFSCLFSPPVPGTQKVQKTKSWGSTHPTPPLPIPSGSSRTHRTLLFNVLFRTLSFPPSSLPWPHSLKQGHWSPAWICYLALLQARYTCFLRLTHQRSTDWGA